MPTVSVKINLTLQKQALPAGVQPGLLRYTITDAGGAKIATHDAPNTPYQFDNLSLNPGDYQATAELVDAQGNSIAGLTPFAGKFNVATQSVEADVPAAGTIEVTITAA